MVASACNPNCIYKMEDSLPSMSEVIKDVANLMYDSLPPRMRTCLLYLSMYAQGCVIKKDELVKQWAVEGFLGAVRGRDAEESAEGYFDEFVSRGLVQAVDIGNNGEVLSCTVHQLVLDFIRHKSMEENFIMGVDNFQSTPSLPDKVRRLSVQFARVESARIVTSHVRSLVVLSNSIESVPCITDYGLLRVLVLQICADEDNKSLDLAGITKLFLLKYLKIETNITVQIPEKIQRLQHLETLQVHAPILGLSMVSLPPALQILKLSRHCCIFSRLPEWMEDLVSLCILKIAIKELSGEDIDMLKKLPSLTTLTLYIQTAPKDRIVITKEGFKVLTYFKFRCAAPCLSFAPEAMPKVQKLKLGFNANKMKPHSFRIIGFPNLAGLTEVSVKLGSSFYEYFDIKTAECALESAVWNPLHTPTFIVQSSDVTFFAEEDKSTETEDKEEKHQRIEEGKKKINEYSEEDVSTPEMRYQFSSETKHVIRLISSISRLLQHFPFSHLTRYVRTGRFFMKHPAPSVDVVTGALGSLLSKLLDLHNDGYNLEAEVKGKLVYLHKKLESLQNPLREVAQLEQDRLHEVAQLEQDRLHEAGQLDEVLNAWARDVWDLSYDAEDIVESLQLRVEGSDPDMELKDGIDRLILRTSALASREKGRHESASDVLIGKVIEMLGSHETSYVSEKLMIVSIVGMRGLGKTTLAAAVYNKICLQYNHRAFISVSRVDRSMRGVYEEILDQIDEQYEDLSSRSRSEVLAKKGSRIEGLLSDQVKRLLEKKRYMFIENPFWRPSSMEVHI